MSTIIYRHKNDPLLPNIKVNDSPFAPHQKFVGDVNGSKQIIYTLGANEPLKSFDDLTEFLSDYEEI